MASKTTQPPVALCSPSASNEPACWPEIQKMLEYVSQREAAVIARRWGLHEGAPKTLDEIGREFGVTRERIRQIEIQGLAKLREKMSGSPLAVTDGEQIIDIVDIRRSRVIPSSTNPREVPVLCPQCNKRRFLSDGVPYVGGRPRRYCSNACRRAAHTARAARRMPGRASKPVGTGRWRSFFIIGPVPQSGLGNSARMVVESCPHRTAGRRLMPHDGWQPVRRSATVRLKDEAGTDVRLVEKGLIPGEELALTLSAEETSEEATDESITARYIRGEIRIVTEQGRSQLPELPGIIDSGRYLLEPQYQRRHRWGRKRSNRGSLNRF